MRETTVDPRTFVVAQDEADTAPDAVDDSFTTEDGVALVVQSPGLVANDTDPDTRQVTGASQGANGSVLLLNSNGGFRYTPNPGFVGDDSFTYSVSDGVETDEATVTITVSQGNTPPRPVDDAFRDGETLLLGAPGLLENDSDADGDPLTVTDASDPDNGTATVGPYRSLLHTPDPCFLGEDSFTYTVSDGLATATATVTVTVANATPQAADDVLSTNDGETVTLGAPGVLGNDGDPMSATC